MRVLIYLSIVLLASCKGEVANDEPITLSCQETKFVIPENIKGMKNAMGAYGDYYYYLVESYLYSFNIHTGEQKDITFDDENFSRSICTTAKGVGLIYYEAANAYDTSLPKKIYFKEFDAGLNEIESFTFEVTKKEIIRYDAMSFMYCHRNDSRFYFGNYMGDVFEFDDNQWNWKKRKTGFVNVLTGEQLYLENNEKNDKILFVDEFDTVLHQIEGDHRKGIRASINNNILAYSEFDKNRLRYYKTKLLELSSKELKVECDSDFLPWHTIYNGYYLNKKEGLTIFEFGKPILEGKAKWDLYKKNLKACFVLNEKEVPLVSCDLSVESIRKDADYICFFGTFTYKTMSSNNDDLKFIGEDILHPLTHTVCYHLEDDQTKRYYTASAYSEVLENEEKYDRDLNQLINEGNVSRFLLDYKK